MTSDDLPIFFLFIKCKFGNSLQKKHSFFCIFLTSRGKREASAEPVLQANLELKIKVISYFL